MTGKRLVEVEDIMYILDEMFNISLRMPEDQKIRLNNLERYVRERLLKENKVDK